MAERAKTRPYRKRRRARTEEETRRRITEAVVELHRTVGPASTTVADIARRAGVTRMTVYNHFPTDTDLFEACSSHWSAHNPLPDPSAWAGIGDPSERLVGALTELYEWYGPRAAMVGNVMRDASNMPSLAAVMAEVWGTWTRDAMDVLSEGWSVGGEGERALRAMLRLVLDFSSWRALADSGLTDAEAAGLAARMVRGAIGAD